MEPFTEEGTAEVTFVFVDGQPTGFIVDLKDTDSGSGSDSGTGDSGLDSGGDSNALSVFDLNSTHLFALTGSESAFEGNYSIVEEDDGQGGTYLHRNAHDIGKRWRDEDPIYSYP